jgi:uncharacterized cupin superfamily protein
MSQSSLSLDKIYFCGLVARKSIIDVSEMFHKKSRTMAMPICPIDEALGKPDRGAPAPDRLISGSPGFETWSTYESADGKYFTGLWRATPGAWRIVYTE